MDSFCLLAYIPSVILIVWLLIELRKFVIVDHKLKQTEITWNRIQKQRTKTKDERLIETIPPPPPTEYSTEYSDRRGYDNDRDLEHYENGNVEHHNQGPIPRRRHRPSMTHRSKPGSARGKIRRDTSYQDKRATKHDYFDFESEDISEVTAAPPPVKKKGQVKNRRKDNHQSNKNKRSGKRSSAEFDDKDIDWE